MVHQQELGLEEICNGVIEFRRALAGLEDGLILPLILLILKPGMRFWGFGTGPSDETITARIRDSVDNTDLQEFAQLRIKD